MKRTSLSEELFSIVRLSLDPLPRMRFALKVEDFALTSKKDSAHTTAKSRPSCKQEHEAPRLSSRPLEHVWNSNNR